MRCLILPLLVACPAVLSAKKHVAEHFDVRVGVQPDATLRVVETVRFHFLGGSYSYVTRELPKRRLDAIADVRAEMDGVPARVEIDDNTSRVKVVWRFDAASGSTHEFTLSYVVEGAVRQEPANDQLICIPERHDYEILAARVVLDYPPSAAVSDSSAARAVDAVRQNGPAVFSFDKLRRNRGAAVSIDFRRGFVASAPRWQIAEDERGPPQDRLLRSARLPRERPRVTGQ